MARAPQQGDVIYVKPGSNVYTALSALAFVLALLSVVLLYLKATQSFGADFDFLK